jgi:glycosyltransferase involved in cell wall biosynthesis
MSNRNPDVTSAAQVSVVIPAKNEAATIGTVVAQLRRELPQAEIVVVDDGSTDDTGRLATEAGARVVRHQSSRGNGAAIKTGARAAQRPVIVFMDADGQHAPADVPRLLARLDEGFDLVVGARSGASQAGLTRRFGNGIYNWLSSLIVGKRVEDLTSGFRAVRADKFREILYLLPNGFSYPTSSTMAFFRSGYGVSFVPIEAGRRQGRGHINILRDGGRFLLIIFRIGTLYSPLKIFFPIAGFFLLAGLGYCAYTLLELGRFTNFGALLLITSVLVLLIGLVSEQITVLLYSRSGDSQ